MGSLNGDIMVIRNGRSTSQVSVYNYPEHLNPFYEDDQHKRLRFWKINKKDNEGRRNSFSIGNLKDMWAFKSFRMKKKSSTLGVNKTSESPPLMRRDYALDNGWNTFDNRLRASNTPSINGDSFQRNATYRSSLQTLPTNSERIGLNRNDGYRSTIQVTRSNPRYQPQQKQQQQTMGVSQNRRYVYGGSVTPQPLRNTLTNTCKEGSYECDCDSAMIRRSSQSSLVSTNPFESDDDENEQINSRATRNAISGSTTTLTSQTPRKKRRAPAPPTPVHGRSNGAPSPPIIRIEPSHDITQDELRIEEDLDISNLTAEIESFVKTKSNDSVEVTQASASVSKSLDNREKVTAEKVETTAPPKNDAHNAINTTDCDTTEKEKINGKAKANGQVTTEILTEATKKDTTTADVTELEERKEINVSHVANKIETKIDESKEIKTNGAIPKKESNKNVVAELCIKETNADESPQKPVPLKRQTKPEAEVGHVECIHIHVESPKATPRKEHTKGLSTFKATDVAVAEVTETITNKTPFVLTSPPVQKKRNCTQTENTESAIKGTVKIIGTGTTSTVNKRTNELTINEDRINAKPEISVKPIVSPKPVTKESNGKIHEFAEIHKPMRRHLQNGHIKRTSRDGSISPPLVPQPLECKEKGNQKKIINKSVNDYQTNVANVEKLEETQFEPVDSLKIVETSKDINSNGMSKPIEEYKVIEVKESNCETSVDLPNHNVSHKRDDELDFLYRPKPASQMEWKRSTLAPLETNIPPEKRKSVKDIIESINRSQRLLNAAANKDFTLLQNQNKTETTHPSSSSAINNNNLDENLKILDETQKEIDRMIEEAEQSSANTEDLEGATSSPSQSPSNYNSQEYAAEAQKQNNNEIFQKCRVKKEVYDYRESSPITSNLDWNPVPKPKRTKPGQD